MSVFTPCWSCRTGPNVIEPLILIATILKAFLQDIGTKITFFSDIFLRVNFIISIWFFFKMFSV